MNTTATPPLDILIRRCTALTAEAGRPLIEDAVIGIRGDRLDFVGSASEAAGLEARRVAFRRRLPAGRIVVPDADQLGVG